MPRLVKEPLPHYPHVCVVTNKVSGEFVDFEAVPDANQSPHIYIIRGVVEHAARTQLGMVDGEKVAKLTARVEEMGEELEQLRELKEATETVERLTERTASHAS